MAEETRIQTAVGMQTGVRRILQGVHCTKSVLGAVFKPEKTEHLFFLSISAVRELLTQRDNDPTQS